MNLNNPDSRRGWRTVVATGVVIVLLLFVGYITNRLTDVPGLREIARWSLGIIGLFMLGYVMENGLRSFKWNLPGGFGGEASTDAPEAAQAVADSAQTTADVIKDKAS